MTSIQKAIQQLGNTATELYGKVCKVVKVDDVNKLCDVAPIDGTAEILDVPYSVDITAAGELKAPKKGSFVLVVFVNKNHARICAVSAIELYELVIDTVKFKVDKNGVVVKKANESLQSLVAELITAIRAMKFTTNTGATITLLNDAQFISLQTKFNDILKHN